MSANKKKALGRGLGALLENPETDVTSKNDLYGKFVVGAISSISIDQIEANPYQPRNKFEEEALAELAFSIEQQGIISPLTVRKLGYDKYQLITGERRLRAAKMAGLIEIPAYIRIASDQQMLEMAIVENLQREDLNAIEIAIGFQRLIDECKLTQEQLGKQVGKNRSTITNFLRLLKLPAAIQIGLSEAKITMGHARALINIDDTARQLDIYNQAIEQQLSVREVEELVRSTNPAKPPREKKNSDPVVLPEGYEQIREDLKKKFETEVELKLHTKGSGSIVIPFRNEEALQDILKRLG
jgi:ParB family transcriptional regulator, chromosome partitioning protein